MRTNYWKLILDSLEVDAGFRERSHTQCFFPTAKFHCQFQKCFKKLVATCQGHHLICYNLPWEALQAMLQSTRANERSLTSYDGHCITRQGCAKLRRSP
jgi:hypothetical protein